MTPHEWEDLGVAWEDGTNFDQHKYACRRCGTLILGSNVPKGDIEFTVFTDNQASKPMNCDGMMLHQVHNS